MLMVTETSMMIVEQKMVSEWNVQELKAEDQRSMHVKQPRGNEECGELGVSEELDLLCFSFIDNFYIFYFFHHSIS